MRGLLGTATAGPLSPSTLAVLTALLIPILLIASIVYLCVSKREVTIDQVLITKDASSLESRSEQVPVPPPIPAPRDSSINSLDTLDGLETRIKTVCAMMNGSLTPGKIWKPATLRKTDTSVILDVSTTYQMEETVVFYFDHRKYQRHMKMHERLPLRDIMPHVVHMYEPATHRTADGRNVIELPSAIFMSKTMSIEQRLGSLDVNEQWTELLTMWQALAEVLMGFHQSNWFVRDVTKRNVVYVQRGMRPQWTFLELGNSSSRQSRVYRSEVHARSSSPEVAKQLQSTDVEKIQLSAKCDMWCLGMLVYELLEGKPYWDPSMLDEEVIRCMADEELLLPHEAAAVHSGIDTRAQAMLSDLLQRDPDKRIDARTLRTRMMEADFVTDWGTLNNTYAGKLKESTIVLE